MSSSKGTLDTIAGTGRDTALFKSLFGSLTRIFDLDDFMGHAARAAFDFFSLTTLELTIKRPDRVEVSAYLLSNPEDDAVIERRAELLTGDFKDCSLILPVIGCGAVIGAMVIDRGAKKKYTPEVLTQLSTFVEIMGNALEVAFTIQQKLGRVETLELPDESPYGFMTVDNSGDIKGCNKNAARLLGKAPSTLLNCSIDSLPEELTSIIHDTLGGSSVFEHGVYLMDNDMPLRITTTHHRGADGTVQGATVVFTDMTRRFNTSVFDQVFSEEFFRAKRYGRPVTLLMAKFMGPVKPEAGNFLYSFIEDVSRELQKLLRFCDKLIRMSGDEFAVILPETTKEDVLSMIERLDKTIFSTASFTACCAKGYSIRIGSATFPDDGSDRDDIIHNAKRALYSAVALKGSPLIAARASATGEFTIHQRLP